MLKRALPYQTRDPIPGTSNRKFEQAVKAVGKSTPGLDFIFEKIKENGDDYGNNAGADFSRDMESFAESLEDVAEKSETILRYIQDDNSDNSYSLLKSLKWVSDMLGYLTGEYGEVPRLQSKLQYLQENLEKFFSSFFGADVSNPIDSIYTSAAEDVEEYFGVGTDVWEKIAPAFEEVTSLQQATEAITQFKSYMQSSYEYAQKWSMESRSEKPSKIFPEGVEDLEVMWHVTTAYSEVLREGFKTKRQLREEGRQPGGLGGGQDDSISFTASYGHAKGIRDGVHYLVLMAHDPPTAQQILDRFREMGMSDEGLEKGIEYYNSSWGGSLTDFDAPMEFKRAIDLYRPLLMVAEGEGLVYDPFFSGPDEDVYKNIDPEDVQIIEAVVNTTDEQTTYHRGEEEWRIPVDKVLSVGPVGSQETVLEKLKQKHAASVVHQGEVYRKEAKVIPIDDEFVSRLRKEFLWYMKNVKVVHNYGSALEFLQVGSKYKKSFHKMFFDRFTNKYLKYRLGLNEYWAEYWGDKLRSVGWDFYLEIEPPLDLEDDYHGEEERYNDYQQRAGRWANRAKAKARKLWTELRNFIEQYPSHTSIKEDVKPYVKTLDDENYSIAGFDTVLRGYDQSNEYELHKLLRLAEVGLKEYRERAKERLPWLLKHSIPFIIRFDLSVAKAGEYHLGDLHVELYMTSFYGAKHPVDRFVKTTAHEMAHHLWYAGLSNRAKDFWTKAVSSDYKKTLDLQRVLDVWKNPKPDDFFSLMVDYLPSNGDVETYLQASTLLWQEKTGSWWQEARYRDIEEKIAKGERHVHVPQNPISGYAGKSGSEAFAEAVGLYVTYGEKALYPIVRKWLSITLPDMSIRTASVVHSGEVYRQSRTINDLTEDYLKVMKANDWVRVFHGTGIHSVVRPPQDMVFGIDSVGEKAVSKYHPDTPGFYKYSGLYVAPTHKEARRWGTLIFEFAVKARNLHPTNWGAMSPKQWEPDFLEMNKKLCDKEYPDSFNPLLSGAISPSHDNCAGYFRGHEPQALFKGIAKARDILAVHYFGETYTPQEFAEKYKKDLSHEPHVYRSKGPDPKSTSLTLDEYLGTIEHHFWNDRGPAELAEGMAVAWASSGKEEALRQLKEYGPFSVASAERFLDLLVAEHCDVFQDMWNGVKEARPDADIGDPPSCNQQRAASVKTASPTIKLWHGGRIKGSVEIRPGRTGKAMYGPGIYTTTSYDTATKYAQGGNKTYVVTLKQPIGWMSDVKINVDEMVKFVESYPRLRHKKKLAAELREVAEDRYGSPTNVQVPANILLNLSTHYPILTGKYNQALARWYVDRGVDAELTEQGRDEDWVVIFNPAIIESVEPVSASDIDYSVQNPDFPKVAEQLASSSAPVVQHEGSVYRHATDSKKVRIKTTPNQNYLVEAMYEVAMTEHPEEEWAQLIKNEVVWKRTYIEAPIVFWEDVLEVLEGDKEWRADDAVSGMTNCEGDERCQDFARRRVLQSYDLFITKIRKAISGVENRETGKKSVTPLPTPTPIEEELVQQAIELERAKPFWENDKQAFIGYSPGGVEWMYYKDSGKDLDQMVDVYMKHWQRWVNKKSSKELRLILDNPQGVVEQQFAELVKKPVVAHKGSVYLRC